MWAMWARNAPRPPTYRTTNRRIYICATLCASVCTRSRAIVQLDHARGARKLLRSRSEPMTGLEDRIKQFVELLRREHAQEIANNPHEFKKQVLKAIRRSLPLKRGRPATPQIEAAL